MTRNMADPNGTERLRMETKTCLWRPGQGISRDSDPGTDRRKAIASASFVRRPFLKVSIYAASGRLGLYLMVLG